MNDIQVFNNEDFGEVRSMMIDGEPWFVGKDVAEKLGYKDATRAIRDHIDDDDKLITVFDTNGGKQQITIINEAGVYSLIFSSKLESAKAFKKWVTHTVLPEIRKKGYYGVDREMMLIDKQIKLQELQNKEYEYRLRKGEIYSDLLQYSMRRDQRSDIIALASCAMEGRNTIIPFDRDPQRHDYTVTELADRFKCSIEQIQFLCEHLCLNSEHFAFRYTYTNDPTRAFYVYNHRAFRRLEAHFNAIKNCNVDHLLFELGYQGIPMNDDAE